MLFENQIFSFLVLLSIGVLFLIIELLGGMAFIFLWFALGCFIFAFVALAFQLNILVYLGLSIVLGAIMMFALRKSFLKLIHVNTDEKFEIITSEGGIGEIVDSKMLKFKGTFWRYVSDTNDSFEEGEEVLVINVDKPMNRVKIAKKIVID